MEDRVFQVIIKRFGRNGGYTFNHYVHAPNGREARRIARARCDHAVPRDLRVCAVRAMRPAETAHNFRSIFENHARFVA